MVRSGDISNRRNKRRQPRTNASQRAGNNTGKHNRIHSIDPCASNTSLTGTRQRHNGAKLYDRYDNLHERRNFRRHRHQCLNRRFRRHTVRRRHLGGIRYGTRRRCTRRQGRHVNFKNNYDDKNDTGRRRHMQDRFRCMASYFMGRILNLLRRPHSGVRTLLLTSQRGHGYRCQYDSSGQRRTIAKRITSSILQRRIRRRLVRQHDLQNRRTNHKLIVSRHGTKASIRQSHR